MPDFGSFRGFGEKLVQGQTPTQLGKIGSQDYSPLLLDAYPNASAAYSVRKLRTAYIGSAIRVRRSSDNAESDIGFTGLNLDTTTLTSFCGSGNGFVTTWYDQSGNAKNATQTTAINQPQIVSSGSLINVNSNPSIKFDGSNDFLSITNLLNSSTSSTGFFIAKATSASSYGQNTLHNIGTVDDSHLKYPNNVTYDGYSSTARKDWTDTINYSLQNIIAITSNSNLYNFTVNNNSVYNTTTNTFKVNISNSLGKGSGASYWDGNFQEVIIYASEQSSNLTGINTNINLYYAIY